MIAVCTRNLFGCLRTWETSDEDANHPGDDLQGPECPACYRRRKGMGTGPRTAHGAGGTPNVTDAASGNPKAAPNPGGNHTPRALSPRELCAFERALINDYPAAEAMCFPAIAKPEDRDRGQALLADARRRDELVHCGAMRGPKEAA